MYFYTDIYMLFIEIFLYWQDFTQEGKQAKDKSSHVAQRHDGNPKERKRGMCFFPN